MSYYRISYSDDYYQQLNDDMRQPLRYVNDYTLHDMGSLDGCITFHNRKDICIDTDIIDDIEQCALITDRARAAQYIRANKGQYQYIGLNTGNIDRILCVEITTINGRDRTTAALYDSPEYGLIWLDMYYPMYPGAAHGQKNAI